MMTDTMIGATRQSGLAGKADWIEEEASFYGILKVFLSQKCFDPI